MKTDLKIDKIYRVKCIDNTTTGLLKLKKGNHYNIQKSETHINISHYDGKKHDGFYSVSIYHEYFEKCSNEFVDMYKRRIKIIKQLIG